MFTGSSSRYTHELAARLKLRVVGNVPPPQSIADIRRNIASVAAALGRDATGAALIAQFDADLGSAPIATRSALLLIGGSTTAGADGVGAQPLRHAGLVQQDVPAGQVSLERLLAEPPQVIVQTQYRSSRAIAWPKLAAASGAQGAARDDAHHHRRWPALDLHGPLVAPEIARLRAQLQ